MAEQPINRQSEVNRIKVTLLFILKISIRQLIVNGIILRQALPFGGQLQAQISYAKIARLVHNRDQWEPLEAKMSPLPSAKRGMYFEEFEAGQTIVSTARTITESDIVTFAGLSGDYNQIHTDAEFSKETGFKQRVAHGILGLSIASGLAVQTGLMEGTIMAFREINNWRFSLPIFIGDTIHVVLTVREKKALPRLGGGSVIIELKVINQSDESVMKGTWTVLIMNKPSE